MHIDQAMILAAGMGKRLHPLTITTPKPLIPIENKPILAYTIERLKNFGIKKIVINTHYLAQQIHDYLKREKEFEIIISHEEELLETGGGILKALPHFQGRPFISVNADIWWEENLNTSLLEALVSTWDDATMDALLVLISKRNAIGFENRGDYHLQSDLRLRYTSLSEDAPYIYGGIQLVHPRLFKGKSLGHFRLPELYHQAQAKGRLFGFQHQGLWCDIGSLNALSQLRNYLNDSV